MKRGQVTRVEIIYDCARHCEYSVPATIPDADPAARAASVVDAVVAIVDDMHDMQCPERDDA